MARKTRNGGKKATLDGLRVQLIPVEDTSAKARDYRLAVQHLIGLMVADLHRRGRPKKDDGKEEAYAV